MTNTYDGFYRLVKVSTPGVPDAVTAIQSCAVDGEAAGSCGTTHGLTEVYRKVTQQAGSPTCMVYLDAVGRALRSTTVGFDGTTVQSTSEYNRKGQMVSQTDPAGDVSLGAYDLLGRPASKTIDYAPQNYRVNYDYNGLTTGMTVTPLGSGSTRTISRTVNSAGKLMSSVDEASKSTKYRYNAAGLPSVIQGMSVEEDVRGAKTTASYNALGHKLHMNDDNQGETTFVYNALGELRQQTDGNGTALTFNYDSLGRTTSRTSNKTGEATRYWSYDAPSANGDARGTLTQEWLSNSAFSKSYHYDDEARLTKTTTTIDGTSYNQAQVYDSNFGRMLATRQPDG